MIEKANAARSFATSWGRPYQSSSQRRPTVRPPTAPPALNNAWTTVGAGQVVAHKPTATQSSQQDIFGIQMDRTDVSRTVSQYGVFDRAYVCLDCGSRVA